MSRSKDYIPPSFAVLILDLESVILIENGLGKSSAELLLKSVSLRLQGCLETSKSQAIISRIDRDQLAILLTNIPS